MTFCSSRFPIVLIALSLLAGCAGSSSGGTEAVYRIPNTPAQANSPPVSESYIIQRVAQPPVATVLPDPPVALPLQEATFAEPARQEPARQESDGFEETELFEIMEAENARREANARQSALAELLSRIETVRAENLKRGGNAARATEQPTYDSGFAPFEIVEAASAIERIPDVPDEAELVAARTAAAEAEAVALAAEAEAARAVREQAAETAARRVDTRQARANPPQQRRPIFGRFATRTPSPAAPEKTRASDPAPHRTVAQPAAPRPVDVAPTPPAPAPRQLAALAAPAPSAQPAPPPRPIVERAPIPGLKPYILARTPSPTAKPRRAKPQRAFDVREAAVLPGSTAASVAPPDVTIPREPGADLSARFFPTPGKPSTLGTDQDTSLDLASIDANPYGIGSAVGDAVDGDTATAEWTDAVRLIENGEVEALAILEDADLELTLCSGRSILTTPPDLSAAATLTAPQIICGQNKPLALR